MGSFRQDPNAMPPAIVPTELRATALLRPIPRN